MIGSISFRRSPAVRRAPFFVFQEPVMATDKTLLLGTRKGLFTFTRNGVGWSLAAHDFPGACIQYACADPRDGTRWACLNYGHWGQHLHRSRDGGKSWETLRKGLPQEGVYDIVFRHARDLPGDELAFGSTTGNAHVRSARAERGEWAGGR